MEWLIDMALALVALVIVCRLSLRKRTWGWALAYWILMYLRNLWVFVK